MNQKVQVWIIQRKQVLLLKVVEDRGSGWHPVTANLDKGESFEDCALREIQEETGIVSSQGDLFSLKYSFQYEGRWGKCEEHGFGFELRERPLKIRIDPKEHVDYAWVSMEEAIKRLSFDSQKKGLQKLIQIKVGQ